MRLGVWVAAVVDEAGGVALLGGVDDGVSLQRHEVVVVVLEPIILLGSPLKLLSVQHLEKSTAHLQIPAHTSTQTYSAAQVETI